MQRKIEIVLGISFVLLGLAVIVAYGVVDWWQNPQLTQIQLFQKNWMYFFLGVFFTIIGFRLVD